MGYSSDGVMGSGTVLGGAILLILLFGIFFNRGGAFGACGGGCGGGCGGWNDGWGWGGFRNPGSFVDRDVWMTECNLSKQISQAQNENQLLINQLAQRTDLQTATITTKMDANEISNLRDQLASERSERLATRNDALQQQIATNAQFQDIRNQLCQLGYAVSRTVQTPPFKVCGTYNPCDSCCNA